MKKISQIIICALLCSMLSGCAVLLTRFGHSEGTYPAFNTDLAGICWMSEGRDKKYLNSFEFYGISTLCVIDMFPSVVVDTVLYPWDYFKPKK